VSDTRPVAEVRVPTRQEWADIVAGDPSALPEQTPEWTDAICASAGYRDASRLYELGDGRRFVLPLVARRGLPGAGRQLWSFPPAWGIGGPVGAGLDTEAVTVIADDLISIGAVRIGLRPNPLDQVHWQHVRAPSLIRLPRRVHVIDLDHDIDRLLAATRGGTRQHIRRASRPSSGVEVRVGRAGELLDDHYRLFLESARRWSAQQHEPLAMTRWRARRRDPIAKLQAMARRLGSGFVVVVGYCNGQPASSAVILLGPTTRYTRGATDVQLAGSTGVTSLVHWTAITIAADHGSTVYNMGESGWASGLSKFKERFGARPVEYDELRFERLPITKVDQAARSLVKRAIGFKEPS
jgi:hypothetical protein